MAAHKTDKGESHKLAARASKNKRGESHRLAAQKRN